MSTNDDGAHRAPTTAQYDVAYLVGGIRRGPWVLRLTLDVTRPATTAIMQLAERHGLKPEEVQLQTLMPVIFPPREDLAELADRNAAARSAAAMADVEAAAYAVHERAARSDVHSVYVEALGSAGDVAVALRMTKVAGMQMVRDAGTVSDDRYLLARVRGVIAGLAEVEHAGVPA